MRHSLDKTNNAESPPAFEDVVLLLTIAIILPLALWLRDLLPIEEKYVILGTITTVVLIMIPGRLLLKRFRRQRAFNTTHGTTGLERV